MAKGSNSLTGRRSSSHNTKPYDANNSFVKKVATKVTDLIPQRSWISKWFNTSQGNGDILDETENPEDVESEEDVQKPPPLKRPRIRMDVTHPPGTFFIQPRVKTSLNKADPKDQYAVHDDTTEDFSEPAAAGPSGRGHLISSTPATETDVRGIAPQRSDLNSLVVASNNGTTNGTDDNSESSESTSGCSSLIPQMNRQEAPSNVSYSSPFSSRKRFIDDKLTFTNHLQSPRSLFLDSSCRDSLSSRRPSFNASVMTNTLDHASPLSSPFYSGNITFGGANAAGLYKRSRSLLNNSNEFQLKVPRRTNVNVKPANAAGVDSSGMSQTAKKILEALEHFSSPITDAKKIPLKGTNNTIATPTSKKRTREETTSPVARVGLRHLTRELTVPTVPDILKFRRRQKLQDTTAAARKIVSARSEPPRPQEYHLRTQADEDAKRHGKIKVKAKVNLEEEDTIQTVNLPNIQLPITSLPNFDFAPPQNSRSIDSSSKKKEETFTFASPIKVTNISKNLKSINNFTFSSPISADSKQSLNSSTTSHSPLKTNTNVSTSSTINCSSTITQNFIWSGSSTAARPKEKAKNTHASYELKTGMDILFSKSNKGETDALNKTNIKVDAGKDISGNTTTVSFNTDVKGTTVEKVEKPKSASSQDFLSVWECSECMIKNNNSETQCVACKAPKPNKKDNKISDTTMTSNNESKPKNTGTDCFGSQFKISGNQWECAACYVRNKQSDVKCVACSAAKPSSKDEVKSNAVKSEGSVEPAEGQLKCPSCTSKSIGVFTACTCNTLKPNSVKVNDLSSTKGNTQGSSSTSTDLVDKFKPSKDSWECPCCMVRNDGSADSCPCCNTAKPKLTGALNKKSQPPPTNGFGDKFKKPAGSWTCSTCMIQNEANVTKCIACETQRTTTSTAPSTTAGFKFGIDKADREKLGNVTSTNGFKFGDSQQSGEASKFTFGIPKDDKEKLSATANSAGTVPSVSKSSGGTFGFNVNATSNEATTAIQDTKKAEEKSVPTFSFGIPKTDTATVTSEKQTVTTTSSTTAGTLGFTFGMPKPEVKQTDVNNEKSTPTLGNVTTEISKPSTETTASTSLTLTSSIATTGTTQSSSADSKQNPTFTFCVPSSTTAVSASTSTNIVSTGLPSSTPSFAFPKPKTETSTVPAFGQVTTSTPTTGLSTTFTFGENKAAETAPTTLANSSTTTPSIFSKISTTPTLFGNNETKTGTAFGAEENKPSTFGTTTSKPSAFVLPENKVPAFSNSKDKLPMFGSFNTKMPLFENTEKPATLFNSTPQAFTTTPAPTFETPAATSSLFGSTTTPVFGNNPPSSFGTGATPSIFSTTKANETTTSTSNLFTFGATPAQPVAQSGNGFNFSGNTNPPTSPQKPLFTFGNNTNTAQNNNLFGTFKNPTPNNSAGFTFNAPKPETPAFGQTAPVATAIFGTPQPNTQNQPAPSFSSAQSSNAGFNFGFSAPATSSSGFNFGGMAPASTPSGGFNFNQPSSTPTFDPNTRPSFNFTGGSVPLTFNATPQSSVPRKIKKAVRRMR